MSYKIEIGESRIMSDATLENILKLFESMDQHTAQVEERMRNAGLKPNPLIAQSIAKYWDAIEKLAAE